MKKGKKSKKKEIDREITTSFNRMNNLLVDENYFFVQSNHMWYFRKNKLLYVVVFRSNL
jgi:hypothetical protein